jgi:ribonuclease R
MGRTNKQRRAKKSPTRGKSHARPVGQISIASGGYGFVATPEGEYFVPQKRLAGAMNGDTVEISISKNHGEGGSRYRFGGNVSRGATHNDRARVVRVVARAMTELVGQYFAEVPLGVVVPDDKRILHDFFVIGDVPEGLSDEDIVVLRIVDYPTPKSAATGQIVRVIGREDDPHMVFDRLVAASGARIEFSQEALAQAEEARVNVDAAFARGYRDLRDRIIFTIDPADAKDFDDALSIDLVFDPRSVDDSGDDLAHCFTKTTHVLKRVRDRRVWRLGVHIADVSAYVLADSSLDLEARMRGTSIYLPDRVIPMLPEALSNDVCSLKPNESRLSMTCDIYIDDSAALVAYDLYPAVICSKARLTYDEAQGVLNQVSEGKNVDLCGDIQSAIDISSRLVQLSKIAKAREDYRCSCGSIDFDTAEPRAVLDAKGNPVNIDIRRKTDATGLVEEAMIFANEVVATHLLAGKYPCVFRDHEPPTEVGLANIVGVFAEFPWFSRAMSKRVLAGDPAAIRQTMQACVGRPEHDLVVMLSLRAMSRAVYSAKDAGHYGLGLDAYCHFTSPIRRYPDLIVHRLLHRNLRLARPGVSDTDLNYICETSSIREREAETLSRNCTRAAFAKYMQRFIGQTFSGLIVGVAQAGLFVRLDNMVEGIVAMSSLGQEYFVFNESRHTLTGVNTKRVYRLGEPICVKVKSADPLSGKIEFELAKSRRK